jgi:hypothetical protein
MMFRAIVIFAALVSPFFFPILLTLILSCVAGLFIPFLAFFIGASVDILHYTPGVGLPLGTLFGVVGAVLCFFARTFIKARMMLPNV